jgi:hypothetical protein
LDEYTKKIKLNQIEPALKLWKIFDIEGKFWVDLFNIIKPTTKLSKGIRIGKELIIWDSTIKKDVNFWPSYKEYIIDLLEKHAFVQRTNKFWDNFIWGRPVFLWKKIENLEASNFDSAIETSVKSDTRIKGTDINTEMQNRKTELNKALEALKKIPNTALSYNNVNYTFWEIIFEWKSFDDIKIDTLDWVKTIRGISYPSWVQLNEWNTSIYNETSTNNFDFKATTQARVSDLITKINALITLPNPTPKDAKIWQEYVQRLQETITQLENITSASWNKLFQTELVSWKKDLKTIADTFEKIPENIKLKEEFQEIRDKYKNNPAERARKIKEFMDTHPNYNYWKFSNIEITIDWETVLEYKTPYWNIMHEYNTIQELKEKLNELKRL